MAFNLIIDTSMAACTVGLFQNDEPVFEQSLVMRNGHQEALGGLVMAALDKAKIGVADLAKIGVTLGPGSFTGLRIGLSFAKGLSVGAGVNLVGLSALEALLFHPDITANSVTAIMDGGRGKLFVQSREKLDVSMAQIIDTKDDFQFSQFRSNLLPETFVTGNISEIELNLQQSFPHCTALNALMRLGHFKHDLNPLYMREADATVSQKPVLHL